MPIALAVGVGVGCLDMFYSSIFFLSLSLRNGPIKTEILSQRAVNPKITNQPNSVMSGMRTPVYSCYYIFSKVSNKNACRSISDYSFYESGFRFTMLCCCMKFAEKLSRWWFPKGKLVTLFQFLLHSAFYFLYEEITEAANVDAI